MEKIEKVGKTADDAVQAALKTLNTSIDKVDVTILEHGTKGILGIGAKPARVLVCLKIDPEQVGKDFLNKVLQAMGLKVVLESNITEKQLYMNMIGDDLGILIGKRGQTLDSLQYLLNLVINKGSTSYLNVTLDTENYRQRRKETLESLAFHLAKKAKETKKKVVLEPMKPYERRIIHFSLQNDKTVETYSEGEEPYRYIVISPK